jgi:hypothetical protein
MPEKVSSFLLLVLVKKNEISADGETHLAILFKFITVWGGHSIQFFQSNHSLVYLFNLF